MSERASFHARVMALPAAAHLDPCYDRVKTEAEIQFAYIKGGRAGTDAKHYMSPLIKRHAAAAIASEADALAEAAQGLRVALQGTLDLLEAYCGDYEQAARNQARTALTAYAKAAGESA